MDNKDSSINKMSSFKALNDRDENFDSSLNSAFLKNVNLNGTDESNDDLKSGNSKKISESDTNNKTDKTLKINSELSPIKEQYETFDPKDESSDATKKSRKSYDTDDKRRSSLRKVKTGFNQYLKNYNATFSRSVDDLWAEADEDGSNCLDKDEA